MAKKAKGNRVQVILECTEHKASGMPGTSRYITTKNRKNTTERLELKKYNPILKRVTVHKEINNHQPLTTTVTSHGKETVASLQKGEGRTYSKVIKMVKSPKTGAYTFQEQMVPNDAVKEVLK